MIKMKCGSGNESVKVDGLCICCCTSNKADVDARPNLSRPKVYRQTGSHIIELLSYSPHQPTNLAIQSINNPQKYTSHGVAFTIRRHNARSNHIAFQVSHGINTQRPRYVG